MGAMLKPLPARTPLKEAAVKPRAGASFVIGRGEGEKSAEDIGHLRLLDYAHLAKDDAKTQPAAGKTKIKPKDKKTLPGRLNDFLERPITLKRTLFWGGMGMALSSLPYAFSLADTKSGGALTMNTIDSSVAVAEYMYDKIHGKVDKDKVIETGVKVAGVINYFDTKVFDTLTKNARGRIAKYEHADDPEMVKQAVLPVLFAVDAHAFTARYSLREMIAVKHYPDMDAQEKRRIITRGFLKDVHESFGGADELKDIKLTDRDILLYMGKNPRLLNKMPPDIRTGLAEMIYEQRRIDRDAQRPDIVPAPNVRVEFKPTPEQLKALEAGLPPMPTAEEIRRSDEAMSRAMREYEEAARPKTLGELSEAARRSDPPRKIENISGEMRNAAQSAAGAAAQTVQQATPSPWTAAYCKVRVTITGESFPKCVL